MSTAPPALWPGATAPITFTGDCSTRPSNIIRSTSLIEMVPGSFTVTVRTPGPPPWASRSTSCTYTARATLLCAITWRA
ncbi:MAG: hypothetical protein RXS42_07120 [Nitrososphaeria archaeon]